MPNPKISAVVTDLDGTLLTDHKKVNDEDFAVLKKLGEIGVKRIAATGRSLKISNEVISTDFPIDYLIFSTGSGIYDYKNRQIIHTSELSRNVANPIINRFIDEGFDFTIHEPIPNNHRFLYYRQNESNKHFNKFIELHADYGKPFDKKTFEGQAVCQLLAIIETNVEKYEQLVATFKNAKFVRTTSPFDYKSMWIEVFPKHISKAYGLKFLGEKCNIDFVEMIGVGNDYNDLDFLNVVGYPRVVANAHVDLLEKYPVVASNEQCGFAQAVKQLMPNV